QHPHFRPRVDIRLHGALGGGALAEILDLLALLDAQDLDRLLDVALRLGEGALAIHHARAGPLAQGLDLLRADLGRAHDFPASAVAATSAVGAAACTGSGSVLSSLSAGAVSTSTGALGVASVDGAISGCAPSAAGSATVGSGGATSAAASPLGAGSGWAGSGA